jgi:hypothetical protein
MIPGGGCGRLAQLAKIEAEIHAASRVLQVARVFSVSAYPRGARSRVA